MPADPVEIGRKQYATGHDAHKIHWRNEIASRRNAFDLSYVELRRDPIDAVRRVYNHFGWLLSLGGKPDARGPGKTTA